MVQLRSTTVATVTGMGWIVSRTRSRLRIPENTAFRRCFVPGCDHVFRSVGFRCDCPVVSAGYHRHQTEGGYNYDFAKRESAPGSRLVFNALPPHWRGTRRRQRRTKSMVHGENRIPYRIDRRLIGLAGPEYHAIISFGLPIEPEDSQYGKSRIQLIREKYRHLTFRWEFTLSPHSSNSR